VNDLLTPLAVVGIAAFAVAVVLIAVLYVREAFDVVRLLRSGRVSVRFTSGSEPLEPEEEPATPAESAEPSRDASRGWGFDRS
jgi:hypothetical protein